MSQTQGLVNRLWGYCHILRAEGIDYVDYVQEIGYLLFLKLADERSVALPEAVRWKRISDHGPEQILSAYQAALLQMGQERGPLGEIFVGAETHISSGQSLKKLTSLIDDITWSAYDLDVQGAVFEGLLERSAAEGKKGAGQYFTPRPLIQAIVACLKPLPSSDGPYRVGDPATGTGGFLVEAYEYLRHRAPESVASVEFVGGELVARPRRLALMNFYLHQVPGTVLLGDSLENRSMSTGGFDLVLTNPPFGARAANGPPDRADFLLKTSNKQLNFLQHVVHSLKHQGRAAVVVPDNVLFSGLAAQLFRSLMASNRIHTILRCPEGTFSPYTQGTKTNVIFLQRGYETDRIWVYDARTGVPAVNKSRPLSRQHFEHFIECYGSHPDGVGRTANLAVPRWASYTRSELEGVDYRVDALRSLMPQQESSVGTETNVEALDAALEHLQIATDKLHELRALLTPNPSNEGRL